MNPPVVLFDDPRLTIRADPVDPGNVEDAAALRMVGQYAEMMALPVISAPLFGISKRLILLSHNNRFMPLMNPILVEARDFEFVNERLWHNMPDFRIRTRRPKFVSIQATMLDGSSQNAQVAGENAQLLHQQLELMNGTAPVYTLSRFQQYLAYRLQYFRESSWALHLAEQLLKLADTLPTSSDPHISFDGEYRLAIPCMADISGQPDLFDVDLRDPFCSFSATDQALLHIFSAHHNDAQLSLFQVANPMLVLAANLVSSNERVISVSSDAGKHVIDEIGKTSTEAKFQIVSHKLTDLTYREKPGSIFMDWCWPDNDAKKIETDIRKISKKLTATGVLYLAVPEGTKRLELAQTVFNKVFPRIADRPAGDSYIIAGLRSTNATGGTLQIAENLVPFPWQSLQ